MHERSTHRNWTIKWKLSRQTTDHAVSSRGRIQWLLVDTEVGTTKDPREVYLLERISTERNAFDECYPCGVRPMGLMVLEDLCVVVVRAAEIDLPALIVVQVMIQRPCS